MFHVYGQRFFHHDMDAARGARLDHAAVVKGAGEGGDGFDIGLGEQGLEAGIEEIGVELKAAGVAGDEFLVGLHDADELRVLAVAGSGDESAGVIVGEADDGETEGRF